MSKRIGILGVAAWVVAMCMFTSMGMAAEGDAKAKRPDRAKRGEAAGQRAGGQRSGGQRGAQGSGPMAALAKLDLSEEQQKKIRALQEEMREQQQAWMEDNKDKFAELREEFTKAREGGNREAFAALAKKREAITKDRPDTKESVKKILALLTKDQKEELLIAVLSAPAGGQRGAQAGGRGGATGGQRPGGQRPGGQRPGGKRPGAEK